MSLFPPARVRTTLFVSCDRRNESRYLEMETLSILINREGKTMVFVQSEVRRGIGNVYERLFA
jgi:hypothetical protein